MIANLEMALVVCVLGAPVTPPDELEGSVNVWENRIIVRVRNAAGPGAAVPICLIDGHRKVVANGRTDDKGEWDYLCPKAGKYEVGIGKEEGIPVTIARDLAESVPLLAAGKMPCCRKWRNRETSTPANGRVLPWVTGVLGLGFVGAAGILFVVLQPRSDAPSANSKRRRK